MSSYWFYHHEFDADIIYERMYALCDNGHNLAEYLAWIGLTKKMVDGSADEIRRKYPWKKVEQQIFRFVRECRGLSLRDPPAADVQADTSSRTASWGTGSAP